MLRARFRSAVAGLVTAVRTNLGNALRPAGVAGGLIRHVGRTRAELLSESAMLRQQLIVAARSVRRPAFCAYERGLAGTARKFASSLAGRSARRETIDDSSLASRGIPTFLALAFEAPDRGEIASRPRGSRAHHTNGTRDRLRRAERIRGELLKHEVHVAKRTVRRAHARRMPPRAEWRPSRGERSCTTIPCGSATSFRRATSDFVQSSHSSSSIKTPNVSFISQ